MAINYSALATEINSDPRAYGYASAQGNFQNLADLLNQPREGITVKRVDIAANEVLEAIDIRDLHSSPPQVVNTGLANAWFESITQFPRLTLDGTRVLQNLKRILIDGSQSESRLDGLVFRTGSRAEELFGSGTVVSANDVATAIGS